MSALLRTRALHVARTRAPIYTTARFASGINSGSTPNVNAASDDAAGDRKNLKEGAKRDPELYILLAIMTGAFTLAGWHFSRNPTSSSSENRVAQAVDSEPWKTGEQARYQYHPHGDTSKTKKDAPSALNEVIIPGVNLPKSLHEKYNKWGKEGY
ncbi:hypothetical protein LTR56_017549 [Elasticomyces elasticus]|nr:hypothetical protein LTR22_022409 [Elasticomyces elasticus]KAK3630261.1 hypothetical protein LTR56_017549 [Elasticomyces elasticus]KAK4913901.1 hypothetical protein LTR49_017827 [Elasticomyces elasticus]KAK5679578.1 hypothetical protein LTS10_008399 [Elasticomyces elasticus]KAK5714850.1 hypothetical protein LTR17_016960 [Elasticomyces elasticus]